MRTSKQSPLQELRQRAGYYSRTAFAEELGIPLSTYKRYESLASEECAIPIRAAWQIADKLGCTIDEVVGRREALSELQEARLRDTLALMSEEGRELACELVTTVYMAEKRRALCEEIAQGEKSFEQGFAEYIAAGDPASRQQEREVAKA